jgi:uncharacterized protein YjbJ (UPF0337 family)
MTKRRFAGPSRDALGSIKEAIGKVAGDAVMEAECAAEQAAGTDHNADGLVRDMVRNTVKK